MHTKHGNDLNLGQDLANKRVTLSRDARSTHLYVTGATGTGKSKFLEHLIWQDIVAWPRSKCGMLVLDPHGSLYDNIMARLAWNDFPGTTKRPIVPIDLRRDDWVIAYNLLRERDGGDPSVVVNNFVQAIAHVWGKEGTIETPLFARWVSHILNVLYEKKLTLIEAEHLIALSDKELRRELTRDIKSRGTAADWAYANSLTAKDFDAQISSTINRLKPFLDTKVLRQMFGQDKVSLDLAEALKEGHIILVNLSPAHGRISEDDASLFATLLLSDLWTAARQRGKPRDSRDVRPFYVYMDECQRMLTPSIAQNLDEARGYGLHLTLANQYPNQFLHAGGDNGKRIYDSVMVNARTKVVFAMEGGTENLQPLAESLFMGTMSPDKIKHELYSTKVMNYVEEARTITSRGESRSSGGGTHRGSAGGEGFGGTDNYHDYDDTEPQSRSESRSRFASESSAATSSWSETETESESEVPMLIPVMGKELSAVQFEPLEEQLFRAMASLHDQEQRRFCTRIVGSKAPVSVTTPLLRPVPGTKERIEKYVLRQLRRQPFALLRSEAERALARKDKKLAELLNHGSAEPTEIRRPVERAKM
jgi:hypothetical protein